MIQTALLSFFKKEPWHSSDWTPKNMVILRTQYLSKEREDFNSESREMRLALNTDIARTEKYIAENAKKRTESLKSARATLSELKKNAESLAKVLDQPITGVYSPPALIPLKLLDWDRRIVVTDESGRPRWPKGKKPTIPLEKWTVEASVARPSYSADGNLALIKMSIPWSMHSAEAWFMFERNTQGWKRVAVYSIFYV